MPEDGKGARQRRPSAARRALRSIGRCIGDAALTVGMARGFGHGERGRAASGDHLLARSLLFSEGRRGYEARSGAPGLLDRIPGRVVIVVVIGLMIVAFVTWSR